MSVNAIPLPVGDAMVFSRDRLRYRDPREKDPKEGTITRTWIEWLTRQSQQVAQSARRLFSAALQDQDASIAATDISNGTLAAGLYRVSFNLTQVQSATTSWSCSVTIDWTYRTVSKAITSTALTTNLTSAAQSFSYLVRVDKNSPIRYSTTYASVGATPARYDLAVTLEILE